MEKVGFKAESDREENGGKELSNTFNSLSMQEESVATTVIHFFMKL